MWLNNFALTYPHRALQLFLEKILQLEISIENELKTIIKYVNTYAWIKNL